MENYIIEFEWNYWINKNGYEYPVPKTGYE